ncbi:hypothetical protein CXB51_017146 [Gossypium anomalum]|uniref:Aminotransferase-like plant mobile domain-containing protein n=1 Tax=Gossypium anomalum TaxID=47600 RepID=A0A8J5YUL7_9ROSI|nr:hypothetical protein CXB51_017146 [Gossypium anomalum]
MLDKSRNLVHLRQLLLLADLKEEGRLSWGSAVLETLYREICPVAKPEKVKIGGCMLLLQWWAWWNNLVRHSDILTELEDIQLALDQQTEDEFVWIPYVDLRIEECISTKVLSSRNIWHIKVPLIIFATIEMHKSN